MSYSNNKIPRACPFCDANATRIKVVDKWGAGKGANKQRLSFVLCLSCYARGPIAHGLTYDVRNEHPSMGARQLLHERAIELWNGTLPVATVDFNLESEVAR